MVDDSNDFKSFTGTKSVLSSISTSAVAVIESSFIDKSSAKIHTLEGPLLNVANLRKLEACLCKMFLALH